MNRMNIRSILASRNVKIAAVVFVALAVLAGIFAAGIFVGYGKARFSYRWGEEYHRNFAGPREGFMAPAMSNDFIEGHGAIGSILEISDGQIVIQGRDGVERILNIDEKTAIRGGNSDLQISDLKAGNVVVGIGAPNDQGQIEVNFLRVMPDPKKMTPGPGPQPELPMNYRGAPDRRDM